MDLRWYKVTWMDRRDGGTRTAEVDSMVLNGLFQADHVIVKEVKAL